MTVDEYLSQAPEPHRSTLSAIRTALREVLPAADEELSYGVPAFTVGGKPVAGYAYFKKHCSYFPHSGSVLETVADQLVGLSWSKGTLQFPVDQPLTRQLVRTLVETRLAELEKG